MYEYVELSEQQEFTKQERREIKWFKIAMEVAPRNLDTGDVKIRPEKLQAQTTMSIFIQAPLTRGSVDNLITKVNSVENPHQLPPAYKRIQAWEPRMKNSDAIADVETFQKKLKAIRDQTEFKIIVQLMQTNYVGERSGLKLIGQRLLKINHRYWNSQTRSWTWRTVAEVTTAFQAVVSDINQENPGLIPNLETTFVQAMPTLIRNKLLDTMRNRPNPSLNQNLADFHRITTEAIKIEKDYKSLNRMAEQAAGRVAGRSTRFRGHTPPKTFLGKRVPQDIKVNDEQILTLMDQAAESAEKEAYQTRRTS